MYATERLTHAARQRCPASELTARARCKDSCAARAPGAVQHAVTCKAAHMLPVSGVTCGGVRGRSRERSFKQACMHWSGGLASSSARCGSMIAVACSELSFALPHVLSVGASVVQYTQ